VISEISDLRLWQSPISNRYALALASVGGEVLDNIIFEGTPAMFGHCASLLKWLTWGGYAFAIEQAA